jgi:hypothetical protein
VSEWSAAVPGDARRADAVGRPLTGRRFDRLRGAARIVSAGTALGRGASERKVTR